MKFLLAIILALIAVACARQSNLAALQDIMNTLQESKSAQTLDSDVEAFEKVSSQGLLEKLGEMKQKLNAFISAATVKYTQRKNERTVKRQKAAAELAQAKTDKATVKANNDAEKAEDLKIKNKALKEVEDDSTNIAKMEGLLLLFKSLDMKDNVIAVQGKLDEMKAENAEKKKNAIKDFDDAEALRRKSLSDAQKIVEREENEAQELKELLDAEQESDDAKFETEKDQCLEELALIESIIALIDPKWFKLGTINTATTNDHLVSSFNDGGRPYSKIKLVNRGGSFCDWAEPHKRSWKSKGLDTGKVALKLSGKWYTNKVGPHKCGSHKYSATLSPSDFVIKKGNNQCWNAAKNLVGRCGDIVEINTKGKKFQGLSDLETIGGCHKGDNKFRYNFDVYGYN